MSTEIPVKDCEEMVRSMGNMFGLLYLHFAKTILDELGPSKGKEVILKAVRNYGLERGRRIREKVLAAGLPLTVENFRKFSDLPPLGWNIKNGEVLSCAYAQPWIEQGEYKIGSIYCEVDVAKYEGYNPEIKVERLKSILLGQNCCKYRISL